MEIRKAKKQNLKEIAEIFRIESAKKPHNQTWNKTTSFKKIKELSKTGEIYFIKVNKKIIGFIIIDIILEDKGKEIVIKELWIKSEYHRKKFGTKLTKFIENKYKKRGIKNIFLLSNKFSKAFKFYKKLKYKVAKDTILMDKKLK